MACGCGRARRTRATTSGDLAPPPPAPEPLESPDGASYRVVNGSGETYFATYDAAVAWQAHHGGKLRTV